MFSIRSIYQRYCAVGCFFRDRFVEEEGGFWGVMFMDFERGSRSRISFEGLGVGGGKACRVV